MLLSFCEVAERSLAEMHFWGLVLPAARLPLFDLFDFILAGNTAKARELLLLSGSVVGVTSFPSSYS